MVQKVETLLTAKPAKYRFYEDWRKKQNGTLMYDKESQQQIADKKKMAAKITSREFIKMPSCSNEPPSGYIDPTG